MKNNFHPAVIFGIALCFFSISAFGAAPGHKSLSEGPGDERIARHALGRADLAERMGLCFQDQAANLRKVASSLLHAKTKKERESLRADVEAAHEALSACLDLSSKKCTKKCSPLPPAAVSTNPESDTGPRTREARVRTRIIAVDNGSIQENKTVAGTKGMRSELDMGISGKNLALRSCYRIALKRDPDLAGMAAYRLVFGPDGRVRKAHLLSTTLANLSLARCALKPLGALHLSAKKVPDKATAIIRLVFSASHR